MKRLFFILLTILGWSVSLSAAHIRGGELYYEYVGPGVSSSGSIYNITLKLYIDCGQNSDGQLDREALLNIFYKNNNARFGNVFTARMVRDTFIRYDPTSNPCIANPPRDVCYRLRYFRLRIELPNHPDGYVVSFQRCCRIESIKNMVPPSNDFGATYLCEIPGTSNVADAVKNSSPLFNTNDAVAVCAGSSFEFDFSAVDKDGDSLSYQFCNAYVGGGPGRGADCLTCPVPNPGAPPPYQSVNYSTNYSAVSPMGSTVSINRTTGKVTGIAPTTIGQFVVTACVAEYRDGILINTHRKDIHIKVSDCIPLKANLNPDYSFCDDFTVTFRNLQVNPTGSVYTWDFGDGTEPQTSSIPDGTIQHTYASAGSYTVKLNVVLADKCADEATTIANVYPGFFPGFTVEGSCIFNPFIFRDTTKSNYGHPSFWRWSFGDETATNDTSRGSPNTNWQYSALGTKTVEMIVHSSVGCRDTVRKSINVTEKPYLILPFTDTLICTPDSLPLIAIGDGTFEWSPNYNINEVTSQNPIVYPRTTTVYSVTMYDKGCVTTETINVRVVNYVTLTAGIDTTICLTDTFALNPQSDGLRYSWTTTPATYLSDPTAKTPLTAPLTSTRYEVEARIGSCVASDAFTVQPVPYPEVQVGPDQTICYNDTAQLEAYTNGSSFVWTPIVDLTYSHTKSPIAHPKVTRTYTFLGFDTLGCPKPGRDRITINVQPKVEAFAGNDTTIVAGQPLLLNGSGGEFYSWSPENGISLPSTRNPVIETYDHISYIMKAYRADGCFAFDTINVRVFQTDPDIFVPNAFAPLGRNNELKPKAVGISSIDYFRVFDRWGKLVFQTSEIDKGWNGYVNGQLQNSGTYVWMASGTDYTGKKIVKKGTAILLR